ncbi:MAG: glycosyltransferase [Candidatus Omnitrophica bacterium]|nr:glycosyltransferase [Candidatus Omnitrophota bacterium]
MDISIVIPTYKRYDLLKQCLDSVLQQDYPLDGYEVIVVDDACEGIIKGMLEGLMGRYPNLRYLTQAHRGPAAARNLGIRSCRGDIIGFIDDDCLVDKDWVRLMVQAHLNAHEIAAVGGLTVAYTAKSTVLASQFLSNCSIETFYRGSSQVIFFPTCNVSLKKEIFQAFRFDENFPAPGGEDLEFFWKLFKDGYRFVWDKKIRTVHYRDETTSSFLKQAYIYGRGNFLAQYLHGDHPLLKELKTGSVSFWCASFINIMKIPRFSYLLGRKLIKESGIKSTWKKLSIYAYFLLHKIFYILGNISEYIRTRDLRPGGETEKIRPPHLFILDVTHSCNLHCRICDIWQTGEREKDIDIIHVKRMLSEAKNLKIKEVSLSGGEALMRKDIFEIFDYARSLGIKNLGVLTNGILVRANFDKLKPYLTGGTISIVVSLDSLRQELHNYIRNSNSAWQETTDALSLLSRLKRERPRVNFNVISIILNQNLEELPELARYVRSTGANSLQFQVLLSNNLRMSERKKSPFWIPEERLSSLDLTVEGLKRFKEENTGFIRNSMKNLELTKKYYRGTLTSADVQCVSALDTILVSNQGDCTTCFCAYGDIKNNKLEDILKHEKIKKSRQMVRSCRWPCLLPCFCDMGVNGER